MVDKCKKKRKTNQKGRKYKYETLENFQKEVKKESSEKKVQEDEKKEIEGKIG